MDKLERFRFEWGLGVQGEPHEYGDIRGTTTFPTQMENALTIVGLVTVTSMLLCYTYEERHPLWILGFAVACALGSLYGFLRGASFVGLVEAVWSLIALCRWVRKKDF